MDRQGSDIRSRVAGLWALLALLNIYHPVLGKNVLEEVIVTAQKREQSINEVPITISAFTGDQLKALGIVDIRDLGQIVPGFRYADTGFNKPVFTLRGVGYNDTSQTASGTVGLYIDEFNLPFPVMTKGPNLDVERIEVMKGPQGTLFGRNTTAGAINSITQKPTEHFEAGITASYGRFQTSDVEGYVSGEVIESLGMRLAVRRIRSTEGWQKSLTRPEGPDGELGRKDKLSARYTVEWVPTEKLNFLWSIDFWEDKGEPQASQPIFIVSQQRTLGEAALAESVRNHPTVPFDTGDMRVADWPPRSEGFEWRFDDSFTMGRFRMNWRFLDDLTLSYLGAYSVFRSDDSTLPMSGLSVLNVEGIHDVDTTAWTQELRLSGTWGADFNYLVGAFASHDDVDQFWDVLLETLSVLFPVNDRATFDDRLFTSAAQVADTKAVFFDVGWQFMPSLSLSAGSRYTEESRDFEGCSGDNPKSTTTLHLRDVFNVISISRGGSGGAGPGECFTLDAETNNPGLVEKSLEEENLSGRLVLDWTPREDMLYYLSFSRGFKSGSFPLSQASSSEQYRPVTQERLDAWELGGKLSLLARSLQFNFAAFHYDYRDKQLLSNMRDEVFGPLPQLANAPESRVKGAEIEVQANPIEGLTLLLTAAYIDSEVIEFVGINEDGEEEDFSGNPFNFTPPWTVSFATQYIWPLPWLDNQQLHVGADYNYVDETNAELSRDPRFHLDAYFNVNYRFGISDFKEKWKLTFWGRNVTNEYQPFGVANYVSDSIPRFVQMPQTYGATFEYRYGGL